MLKFFDDLRRQSTLLLLRDEGVSEHLAQLYPLLALLLHRLQDEVFGVVVDIDVFGESDLVRNLNKATLTILSRSISV